MGFSRKGSQGGQILIVVRAATREDVELAANRTLDQVITAGIISAPLPINSPVTVINDLETAQDLDSW